MADQQFEALQAIVSERLLTRVEHHSRSDTSLTAAQAASPAAVTVAAADAMVGSSSIPRASRPAAAAATATMLAEGFDELPARVAEWQARGYDLAHEARVYGASLGDQTMAAIRQFETRPPNPQDPIAERGQDAAARFLNDQAVPPLRPTRPATTAARLSTPTTRREGPATPTR
ncbi:hypothetical protein [Kribbella sp. NPDC004875]|uniref:hypothetical protein n=1 Tax=Kribbella sp. NPDC004875 TaxID=3364107 RepID=UPI0036C60B4F